MCYLKQLAQTIMPVGHILSSPWAEKAELFPSCIEMKAKSRMVCIISTVLCDMC